MLSSFLKKLLFARQFIMIDGRIEVLGKKQVMLPSDVLSELESLGTKEAYANVKSAVRKDVEDYAKKLGSSEEGILKNVGDIFGTFGLGKLELVDINFKKKNCILRLHNSPLSHLRHNGKQVEFHMTDAILSGLFSFLFKREVDAKQTNIKSGMANYGEYLVG